MVDPFTRKDWYDIKAPSVFKVRDVGKTLVNRTAGTKLASDGLKGRVYEVSLADLQNETDAERSFKKFKLSCEDVQGKNCLTQFYGMNLTTDKLRSMVKKWQTLIEAHVDVKTTDGYLLRVFCIGFTQKQQHSTKKHCYAQSQQIRQICVLKLRAMALHLVFLIRASNKSALIPTECFFKEIEKVKRRFKSPPGVLKISGAVHDGDFLCDLLKQFPETSGGSESRKPGMVARTLQPLLLSKPLDPLSIEDISKVSMSRAIVYEPSGTSDTPLKYTAGLVLAVPVDCDLINVRDTSLVKVAIRTPDQKTCLVTPKMSDFCISNYELWIYKNHLWLFTIHF